ncbi:hypothetical protein BC831DRAFT_452568 [Entophlyctis helioformis]|nr:hypothetical protein BC831DRAFT_452568 [Entophlyctis helioformis]
MAPKQHQQQQQTGGNSKSQPARPAHTHTPFPVDVWRSPHAPAPTPKPHAAAWLMALFMAQLVQPVLSRTRRFLVHTDRRLRTLSCTWLPPLVYRLLCALLTPVRMLASRIATRHSPKAVFDGVPESEAGFVRVDGRRSVETGSFPAAYPTSSGSSSGTEPGVDASDPVELWRRGFFGKASLLVHLNTPHEGLAAKRRFDERADAQAAISASVDSDPEVYRLMLEEAFFLAYAFGCISVHDAADALKTPLDIESLWSQCRQVRKQLHTGHAFMNSEPPEPGAAGAGTGTADMEGAAGAATDFAVHYAVYHYYRSHGWVVKSGHLFGADFVLYRKGPIFRHSDYAVVIQMTREPPPPPLLAPHQQAGGQTRDERIGGGMTWQTVQWTNRVCSTAKKQTLLCHVVVPHDMDLSRELGSVACLRRLRIWDVAVGRWQPERSREL